MRLSIDHALAVSYRRSANDGKTTFVAHVTLVKGIPFYGFHVGYKFFMKIYLHNPLHMTRLADLLRQGAVLSKPIQPYESHMQYLLQWMCDYNLYGCAYLDCSTVTFRRPIPGHVDINSKIHKWHDQTIPEPLIVDDETLPRQSHCSIEVDVCVQNIQNRLEIKERRLHHGFLEHINPIEPNEKLVHSMAGLWRDETRRRKARMAAMNPEGSPFPPEVLISVSADPRNTEPGGWIHEEEYVERMLAIMKEEQLLNPDDKTGFASFVKPESLESDVPTAFESTEDLFPSNLFKILSAQESSQAALQLANGAVHEEISIDVDESRIPSSTEEELAYYSDADLGRMLDIPRCEQEDPMTEELKYANIELTGIGNKAGSGSGISTRQVKDVSDALRRHAPAENNSSAEWAALGIRESQDYIYRENDTFNVPRDYSSDLGSAATRRKRTESPGPASERPTKRRKSVHADYPPDLDEPNKLLPIELSGGTNLLDPKIGVSSSPYVLHENLLSEGMLYPPPSLPDTRTENSAGIPKASTQDATRIESRSRFYGDRTLSFPIFSCPQDLETTLTSKRAKSSHVKVMLRSNQERISSNTPTHVQSSVASSSKNPACHIVENGTPQSPEVASLAPRLHHAFQVVSASQILLFDTAAPNPSDVSMSMHNPDTLSAIHLDAHYGDERDVPERIREYAGRGFKLGGTSVPFLPDFDAMGKESKGSMTERTGNIFDRIADEETYRRERRKCGLRTWEIGEPAPTWQEVQYWIDSSDKSNGMSKQESRKRPIGKLSQIDGSTQKNKHGFKYSQKQISTSVKHETQYMSIMSLEIHVNTRGSLLPNPEEDEIACLFWCLQSDGAELETNNNNDGIHVGILVLSESGELARKIGQRTVVQVEEEASELDLINRMVDVVRNHDPDVLTGFEVHGGSWGYMIERARHKYDYNLCDEFSRMKSQSHGRFGRESDRWGFNHTSTIRVTGRHMINIWRAMRGELNLLQYTMENVVFHLLHRRIPHYAFVDLTRWYKSGVPKNLSKVVDYYVTRVQLELEILEQNELIPRTSEQARLLGVDFFSVFSRGSQFKVESLMFRIAKPENFILISPSRKQVGQQNALECLPLVMEPQSAFYSSPLLVLDFQSLYPSVMIAYNYCYSTFLGRVVNWRGQNKMGFTDFKREARLLELLKGSINIAPNGMMYVKPEIRKSLLAKMLGEILETRVMVKSGMKVDKDDKTLQRLLNNRQLALKLIANVTYGYTSASFSGRMPCSEIADSIVQTGRETLEKAIALIHSVDRWGAEVVYGDTDSLFVYLKGRSKDEAFDIGSEIARTISNVNPRPVKLKFEKVYFPCVLLAKKRYVGFKYESKSQREPEFDAKGIETVRRDGTPAEQKIEEKALKILFRTADLSQVKDYFQRQCAKIMRGNVSIQDFCFAKEVKLGTYSDKGPPPPGALISTRRMLEDPRAEPQYGERVPYVVITGAPGARLIDRCVTPEVLLHDEHSELDAEYYISKNLIPPLERIFNLMGANVRQWYDEMPKFQRIRRVEGTAVPDGQDLVLTKKTLESYMKSSSCLICTEKLEAELPVCDNCLDHPDSSMLTLHTRLGAVEAQRVALEKVCRSCAGIPWGDEVSCDSKDCSVFYTRMRHLAGLRTTQAVMEPLIGMLGMIDDASIKW